MKTYELVKVYWDSFQSIRNSERRKKELVNQGYTLEQSNSWSNHTILTYKWSK